MTNARDYLLQSYLPTTSDKERELWLRTNESAQRFLEIMVEYAKEVVDECNDSVTCWEDVCSEVMDELPDDMLTEMPRIYKNVERVIESNMEEIEKSIRNIGYQI